MNNNSFGQGQDQNNDYYTAPSYNDRPLYDLDRRPPSRGFSIAALLLGIFGLLCCCTGPFGALLGILAIVFACISRKQIGSFDGMAMAGLILGAIATALGAYMIVEVVIMMSDPIVMEAMEALEAGDMDRYEELINQLTGLALCLPRL